jgi:hypothetical protein
VRVRRVARPQQAALSLDPQPEPTVWRRLDPTVIVRRHVTSAFAGTTGTFVARLIFLLLPLKLESCGCLHDQGAQRFHLVYAANRWQA